jgi:hypothetical protein
MGGSSCTIRWNHGGAPYTPGTVTVQLPTWPPPTSAVMIVPGEALASGPPVLVCTVP